MGNSLYVRSAKGAISFLAWGNAPGLGLNPGRALKARFHLSDDSPGATEGNDYALSALLFIYRYEPGALPQAKMNRAFGAIRLPLILKKIVSICSLC